MLVANGAEVDARERKIDLPDPDDVPFLQVALVGRAEALVTGNARDFQPSHGITIVSPSAFLSLLASRKE
jgi:predicted nucleic acid-binding protein